MGYRLGTSEELAERRKARLAARYGTTTPADVDASVFISEVGVYKDAIVEILPVKKKGGRPKGSKNKATP